MSPKKTIEGAVGGFVGAVLSLAVIGHWWLPQMGLPARVMLGLAVAAVGIVGDLFESLLKRSVDMNDASAVIPGHGEAQWGEIFAILEQHNYRGVVSIELEDENFNGSEAGEKAALIHSRNFLSSV